MIRGQYQEACGVILAGGLSRRMGYNKALIKIDGRPLIEVVAEQVRSLTDQVLISSNEREIYDFLGLPVISDLFPGQGPLAGLHAAMRSSSRTLFFLLACDLPNVRGEFLRHMADSLGDHDVIVPCTDEGRPHPLCGIYRRTCLHRLEANLSQGINKVTDLFLDASLQVKFLSPKEGGFVASDLFNINTPNDLKSYLAHVG